jgi:UDP-sulfoquinovose synthase
LANRFDYDDVYGTVLNRFCVEAAVGHPLTVYGSGRQTRAFLDIRDTVRCVELAIAGAPQAGTYRVFNQFTQIFSVLELAQRVRDVARGLGIATQVRHLENPRTEKDAHYYHTVNTNLLELGLEPTPLDDATIADAISTARAHRDRVVLERVMPSVRWAPQPPSQQASSVAG